MKRLTTISLLVSLCLLFSFQAYGQITAVSAGGSAAVTETATTYTITKTNIVLAGAVTVTSISFTTVNSAKALFYDTDSDSIINTPGGSSSTNSGAEGIYVWMYRDGEGPTVHYSLDSLGNVVIGNDLDVVADLTAGTITSDGDVAGTTGTFTDEITITKSANEVVSATIRNVNAGAAVWTTLELFNGATANDRLEIGVTGTGYTAVGAFRQDAGVIQTGTTIAGGLAILTRANAPITFSTAGYAAANERMRIDGSGDVSIGVAGSSEITPTLSIIGDADSDAADTDETFAITITPNATPTSSLVAFTSSQGAGYHFDKGIGVGIADRDGFVNIVKAAPVGATAHANVNTLVVENTGSGGISILTNDASIGYLGFGSPGSNIGILQGWQYSTSTFTMSSGVAGAKFIINPGTGNLELGGSSSDTTDVVGFLRVIDMIDFNGTSATANNTMDDSLDIVGELTSTTIVASGTITTVGLNQPGVAVTNAADYAVLAANTGKRHIIGDLAQVCTMQLPTEAAGLNYEFWYYGVNAETHDHIILTTGNSNEFKGGVVFLDVANAISQSNSNGTSNSSLTINNMNGGSFIKMFCDGTNWFVTGTIVSDAAPTWADQ